MATPSINGIDLPEKTTVWMNEFDGSLIAQSVEADINGTPVIEYISAPKGYQNMVLSCGWIQKSVLDLLKASRDAGTQAEMTLVLPDGREFSVVWNHVDGSPIEAQPVQELTEYEATDYFGTVLNVIRII